MLFVQAHVSRYQNKSLWLESKIKVHTGDGYRAC